MNLRIKWQVKYRGYRKEERYEFDKTKKGVIRAVSAGTAQIRVAAADGSGKSYDFSGKHIYPVSQSASMEASQYAQSVEFIKECAKGAVVDNGIFTQDNETIRFYITDTVIF